VKVVAQLLPFVPEHLPCRILFIEREAEEVIKSQRIMLQRKGKGEEHFDGDQIKKAYDHQLRLVRAAIQNNPNALVLYVRHRDVVGNPSAEAAKINAFLGGELDVSAMAEAVDPELYRNRVA
jgi:hypothetical protein